MINAERLINTFLEIVQIDSPTGDESDMAQYILDFFTALGSSTKLAITTQLDAYGNVIVKIPGEGAPIVLMAHLDTVEPGRGIIPKIKDGIIKSSGNTILGADNKVGVVAILEAVHSVLEKGVSNKSLELVFTISEEVGNLGAINLDYSLLKAKKGFSFDSGAPIGTIVIASPYYTRFDIDIVGKAAHAASPEDGVNALEIFHNALSGFKLGRIDKDTLCNIGVVYGGEVRNTVLGTLAVKGEVRCFVEEKLEDSLAKIVSSFENSASNLGGTIKKEVVRENGGFLLGTNDHLVLAGVDAVESLQLVPNLIKASGCFDANVFIDNGIKILNFANGSKGGHTTQEQISVENLNLIANLVSQLVKA